MGAENTLIVRHLGIKPYDDVWQAMRDFTDSREVDTPDECWILQHEPVFTQGQAGKAEHLLYSSDIPVVKSDRGGQITYHGPGQLIIYWLINLKRHGLQVREFVSLMEQAVIQVLAEYGITAALKEGAPGVYVDQAKIASLGLRVRRGCTYHGLSLNVDMDLKPFQQINPCGYEGMAMAQMRELVGDSVDIADVEQRLLTVFQSKLSYPCIQHA